MFSRCVFFDQFIITKGVVLVEPVSISKSVKFLEDERDENGER